MKFKIDRTKSQKIIAGALAFSLLSGCNIKSTDFCTVTFKNGVEEFSIELKKGSSIYAPEITEKEGYSFEGWYVDGQAFDLANTIESDIVLEAKWEETDALIESEIRGALDETNTFEQFRYSLYPHYDKGKRDKLDLLLAIYQASDIEKVKEILKNYHDKFHEVDITITIKSIDDLKYIPHLPSYCIYSFRFQDIDLSAYIIKDLLENLHIKGVDFSKNAKLSTEDAKYFFNYPNMDVSILGNSEVFLELLEYGQNNTFHNLVLELPALWTSKEMIIPNSEYLNLYSFYKYNFIANYSIISSAKDVRFSTICTEYQLNLLEDSTLALTIPSESIEHHQAYTSNLVRSVLNLNQFNISYRGIRDYSETVTKTESGMLVTAEDQELGFITQYGLEKFYTKSLAKL